MDRQTETDRGRQADRHRRTDRCVGLAQLLTVRHTATLALQSVVLMTLGMQPAAAAATTPAATATPPPL